MADRYSYLPYFGVAFLVAMLIEKCAKPIRYGLYGLALVGSLVWFEQTRTQVDVWQNSDTLWTQVITQYPYSEQAYSIRGNYYGKQASAAQIKQDLALQRTYLEKAEADFRSAIANNTQRADVFEGLGNIEGMRGQAEKALQLYNKAIELNPQKATVFINRGISYNQLGNLQKSWEDMNAAVMLDGRPLHILYRAMAYESLGNIEAAKQDYQAILKLEPNNTEAKKRLNLLNGN